MNTSVHLQVAICILHFAIGSVAFPDRSIAASAAAVAESEAAISPTDGVIRLFDGKSLGDCYTWLKDTKRDDPRKVFRVEDGVLHVSGDGLGALVTNKRYRDYHLVLEYKWGERTWHDRANSARDSGVLVHGNGLDGGYNGTWMPSIEVQIIEGGVGDFVPVPGNDQSGQPVPITYACNVGRDRDGEVIWDPSGARQTFKLGNLGRVNWSGRDPDWKDQKGFRGAKDADSPVGQWTRLDVICDGGHIEVFVNGTKVNEAFDAGPREGRIQLQSELAEMYCRRWELWPLGKGPRPEPAKQEQVVIPVAKPVANPAANPIVEENRREGALDWQLTRVRVDAKGFRSPWIEGYCSRQSVRAGESIDVMVSTNPPRKFEIEIFRTGYYGGRGARLMTKLGPFDGVTQPDPEKGEKNLHECRWPAATTLKIPDDWVSGVYLGRLTTLPDDKSQPYWQSYVIFIVTDDRPAEVLFQCSDNTWQAYNRWPNDFSLYTHPKGTQGPWADVSFDRPYGREAQHEAIVNDPLTVGAGEFLPFEFPLAYWLEEQGYDVAYCSNSDMLTPERGLKCRTFISVGHDEYWDIRQFRSVEAMRDAGVNLLFLSGDSTCWVTPFRAGSDGRANRIIFRGGPYGGENEYAVQRQREHGPYPERGPDEGLLMGARNIEPINGGADWIVTRPRHWMFDGTGMKAGDRVPGLVGWEYHGAAADIPGLEIVAEGTAWVGGDTPQQWTATIYPGPKGNFVFNAATIFWCQGLSSPPGHTLPWSHWSRPHGPDSRVQRITRNLLDRSRETPAPAK